MSKHSKNRQWLEKRLLPLLEDRTLFVGVERYTKDYHKIVSGTFETIDIRKSMAKYGSPHKHHIGDIVHFGSLYSYDNIIMFGLFGQGHSQTNNMKRILKIHQKMDSILANGGLLVSGHRCGAEISERKWRKFFKQDPMSTYKVEYENVLDRQYIWVGRKK